MTRVRVSDRLWNHLTLVYGALLAVATAGFIVVFLRADLPRLLTATGDGAGYYLQIGRNVALGRGFTFDGVHPTNGFHPLWQGLLVALFKVAPTSSEGFYRLVGVVAVGLTGLGCWLFHRAMVDLASPRAAFSGSAVYAALAFCSLTLMESALVLVTTSTLLWQGSRSRVFSTPRPAAAFGFGLLLGLCILARLDLAFLAVALGLALLVDVARAKADRSQRLLRLCLISGGASLLVLPYLAYNQVAFGSIIPISGRLEMRPEWATLSELLQAFRDLGKPRQLPLVVAAVSLAWIVSTQLARPRKAPGVDDDAATHERYLERAIALLAVSVLVHAANELFRMKWTLYWHFVLLLPFSGAVVTWLVQRLLMTTAQPSKTWSAAGAVALVVLALSAKSVRRFAPADLDNDWRPAAYQTAVWMRDHSKKEARLAMLAPEITGYFSERSTIDLNGLSGDLELQVVIRERRLDAYLRRNAVTHLAQASFLESITVSGGARADLPSGGYDAATLRIDSGLWPEASDVLKVERRAELHRTAGCAHGARSCGVIWRFQPGSSGAQGSDRGSDPRQKGLDHLGGLLIGEDAEVVAGRVGDGDRPRQ